jgi:virginiamycin A acetyltransferase
VAIPDPSQRFPVPGFDVTYVKPTITRPNIEVGDFTYYSGLDFESHVTHHYPDVYGDRLIVGKFCQIAAGVEFIMNGANHQMSGASTFPFYIVGWTGDVPPMAVMPVKGDTVIGNDVWIGERATILPGVQIGDGAIIGARAVVGSDVPAYTIVAGNPARAIRRRFDDELIGLLEHLRWWDLPIPEVQRWIPTLANPDLETTKSIIRTWLDAHGAEPRTDESG